MPIQEQELKIDGTINRRDPIDKLRPGQVRDRRNFLVIGANQDKQNRKMPGSDRYTSSAQSDPYTWVSRYYSGQIAKTFAFSGGTIYHIAEDGTATAKETNLEPNAYPRSEIMKISSNNVEYLVDGFNGMYSHDGNPGQEWNKESEVSLNFVQILSHLDRMFGFEEDSEDLYYSANLNATNYTDANDAGLITIGAKRGAKIQAIALLNETLYIFKQDSIYVLEGRTPSTFQVREVHPDLGCAARHSVVTAKTGAIFFLGSDYEVYAFSGTQASTKMLSYDIALGGDQTKNLVPLINKNRANQAYGIFHENLYRLSFTESGETTNNLEYIFNTVNQTDALTEGNNVSCYTVFNKSPDDNDLITGRADTGHLMTQYTGLNYDNDATSPTMKYRLETGSIGSDIRAVRFRRFWARLNVLGADNLNVKTQLSNRLADSDLDTSTIETQGETKGMTNLLRINNQEAITSRGVINWSGGRGQSIRFIIDEDQNDIDLSISVFILEAIVKSKKRNKHVGV